MSAALPIAQTAAALDTTLDETASGAISTRLATITQSMESRFIAAGNTLTLAVESTTAIAEALQNAAGSFETGNGAKAVANLTHAAERLMRISDDVDQRAQAVAAINGTLRQLATHLDDVQKAMKELHIYGFNVKIAAGGQETFVDFADTMSHQIARSEGDVTDLKARLERLTISLGSVIQNDRLLYDESRRIVPHVPQALERDAEALRQHQARLGDVAQQTAAIARSIQNGIAGALAAIQVGDIARQWLEHVQAGYEDLQARISDPALSEDDRISTRNHIIALLLAHLAAVSEQFSCDTRALIGALRGLGSEADGLVSISKGSQGDEGQGFLRSLEGGIAEADTMIAQIRRADSQVAETLGIIVSTLDGLSDRVTALSDLRLEVQLMALNIGVRCRRAERIGRPVAVIADEIRTKSGTLDVTILAINKAAVRLQNLSDEIRGHVDDGDTQSLSGLGDSLSAIRSAAQSTEHAIGLTQDMAGGVLSALRLTTDELELSLDLGAELDQIAALLRTEMGPDTPLSDRPEHPIRLIMERMGRSYTMVSERVVHDQFLLAGATPLCNLAEATQGSGKGPSDDDDDALFADALF
ncbi:hypothetical protein [Novosphingobium sp.]|uniref:hypothetical protein n=1 Tax=Novosphingobium sp. TaxID=1874826 RepID=UPI002637850D|nr:hypothetical protein [Novosphingobium sp.]